MSLVEEVEATDAGAQGLAAADLAGQVSRVLHAALAASGMDQKDLAEKLGVTQGRVSQVLNGDGNLRIAAVARYLRALGYEATIAARPVEGGPTELPARRPPRQRALPAANAALESPTRFLDIAYSAPESGFVRVGDACIVSEAGLKQHHPAEIWSSVFLYTGGSVDDLMATTCEPRTMTHEVEGPSGRVDLDTEFTTYCLHE
ncbi:hypothetical protein A5659_03615 [Mycobacterium sp. 1165196.3]|nr:hypothetical protein A5659_03615 [Mycobacterium sp. 1165196.3]